MPAAPTLFLIDGSNQMYRAYHAIRGLTGPDGKSTNAVYGFVTMLRKLIADHQPEYIAASFDLPTETFRSKLAASYKANRAAMPADLVEQMPWVHEACEALGVPIFTAEGFEADDVIGTLAKKAAAQGFQVAIVTGDKDFFQLVGDGIRVYNPRDEGAWFDDEGVKKKFGVAAVAGRRRAVADGRLVGQRQGRPRHRREGREGSDRHLRLARRSAGEGRRDPAEEIPRRTHQHADEARQSRELVTIRTDVDVSFDPEGFRYRGPSRERCYDAVLEARLPHAGHRVCAHRGIRGQGLRGHSVGGRTDRAGRRAPGVRAGSASR